MRKPLRQILSINEAAILVDRTAQLSDKEFRRDSLRALCDKYELKYNLRMTKLQLARRILADRVRADDLELFQVTAHKAKAHWTYKLESGDKHKPGMYNRLLRVADLVLETLEKIERSR